MNDDVMRQDHVFDMTKNGAKASIKKSLIKFVNNDMTTNWYYLFRLRVVCDNRVFRARFVLWHDAEEVCEYYDADKVSKRQLGEYAAEIAWNFVALPDSFTRKWWRGLLDRCNETINNYNAH